MAKILEGSTFLAGKNGVVVLLDAKELKTTLHALIEGHDRVVLGYGNQYGPMSIGELKAYIAELQKARKRLEG
ncbi:MAG: hypothetical protein COV69_01410 [Parcubacteria group bacterium CG11_big_fil_rev_8_21_14_0_20_39_14]|nr:MAG: hypothetical protein COV69_01410 [Parcubacteria group bacterium CG11_big_fil_rev_8_21_14_0_20_39_14]PIS35107.1 MAG: hypothetical protein COT36_04110 [Parcubacteria group bacterium CG08_land_8_20_14_0_20_38_56]